MIAERRNMCSQTGLHLAGIPSTFSALSPLPAPPVWSQKDSESPVAVLAQQMVRDILAECVYPVLKEPDLECATAAVLHTLPVLIRKVATLGEVLNVLAGPLSRAESASTRSSVPNERTEAFVRIRPDSSPIDQLADLLAVQTGAFRTVSVSVDRSLESARNAAIDLEGMNVLPRYLAGICGVALCGWGSLTLLLWARGEVRLTAPEEARVRGLLDRSLDGYRNLRALDYDLADLHPDDGDEDAAASGPDVFLMDEYFENAYLSECAREEDFDDDEILSNDAVLKLVAN